MTHSPAGPPARSSLVLAVLRACALAVGTLVIFGSYLIRHSFTTGTRERYALAARWTQRYMRYCARVFGFRVTVHGAPPIGPAMLVPNHLGYADILVMGSAVPTLFMTKTSVGSAPLVRHLISASEQVVIDRRRGARAIGGGLAGLRLRLESGQRVCAFLEGTSTAGDRVLGILPTYLQPAIDCAVPVVPVGVRWRAEHPRLDIAEDLAFWKNHHIGPHFWRLLGLRGFAVDIHFGEPIDTTRADRKQLADRLRAAIAREAELPMRDYPPEWRWTLTVPLRHTDSD